MPPQPDTRPIILWVDDRPVTVEDQIAEAIQQGFLVLNRAMPQDVKGVLDDPEFAARVRGVVMDVMLWGVDDLRSIGIDQASTQDGLYAGWEILDKWLRAPASEHRDIPVLVLSARGKDAEVQRYLDRLMSRPGGTLEYVEKGMPGWHSQVTEWLCALTREGA